jgi:hypothetical protein
MLLPVVPGVGGSLSLAYVILALMVFGSPFVAAFL